MLTFNEQIIIPLSAPTTTPPVIEFCPEADQTDQEECQGNTFNSLGRGVPEEKHQMLVTLDLPEQIFNFSFYLPT